MGIAPGGREKKVHKQGPRLPNAAAARDSPQQRRRLGNTASCDGAKNADTMVKLLQFGVDSDGPPEFIECGVRPLPIVYQAIQPPTGTTVSKPRPMSDNNQHAVGVFSISSRAPDDQYSTTAAATATATTTAAALTETCHWFQPASGSGLEVFKREGFVALTPDTVGTTVCFQIIGNVETMHD